MMNCEQAREIIELHFGGDQIPGDLQAHLTECESCRAYYDEMTALARGLGSDIDSPFSAEDFDRATAGAVDRIDRQPVIELRPAGWLRPMLRVAAVLLVVGMSYSSYRMGVESNLGAALDTLQTADADIDRLTVLLEYDTDDELDEDMISILIDDYCTDASYEATTSLLDDISEEELEYLTENFEVGELL